MPAKKPIALLAAVAMLFAAAAASAAEISPQEYKEQVEPICQASKPKEEILKNVRKEVKEGKLKKASRQIATVAAALKQTYAKLAKVPKPADDAARLTKWLVGIKTGVGLLEATGRKLANGEKNAASRLSIRLKANAIKTNGQVLEYQFRYCHVEPSKFLG
jgi:hypothetical protein